MDRNPHPGRIQTSMLQKKEIITFKIQGGFQQRQKQFIEDFSRNLRIKALFEIFGKESRTLSIHYNRNSLAWKCVWDGELYYRIGNFSIQWQKDQYNVSMSFINTIDLDDVSQVIFIFPSQVLG